VELVATSSIKASSSGASASAMLMVIFAVVVSCPSSSVTVIVNDPVSTPALLRSDIETVPELSSNAANDFVGPRSTEVTTGSASKSDDVGKV